MMDILLSPVVVVSGCAAIIAAVTDVVRFKVYNVLTIPLMMTGVVYHSITGGLAGFGESVFGMVIAIGVLLIPFLMGGMGAGDVKLLAGIGAWTGMPTILYVFIVAGLLSGVCGFAMSRWQKGSLMAVAVEVLVLWNRIKSVSSELDSEEWVADRIATPANKKRVIPFAVMVAVGVILTFLFNGDTNINWY